MEEAKKIRYSWTRDKKMIGTIILVVTVILQIFAFLQVPVISTIHAYTIGMLLGYYNPFFYIFVAYKALVMIFGEKVRLPKWIKLTDFTYWLVVISIVFIGTSLSTYYQRENRFTDIGLAPWKSFNVWFADYRSHSAWAPANTNGGIVGAFLYSFFAMISSGIGAMIISIAVGALVVSILVTGSFFGLYKTMLHKKNSELSKKEVTLEDEGKVNDLIERATVEDDSKYEVPADKMIEFEEPKKDDVAEVKSGAKVEDEEDLFPFEDPFA